MIVAVSLGDRDVGLLDDVVSDIIFADDSQLLSPPETTGITGRHVSSLINQEEGLGAVLDVPALFGGACLL